MNFTLVDESVVTNFMSVMFILCAYLSLSTSYATLGIRSLVG